MTTGLVLTLPAMYSEVWASLRRQRQQGQDVDADGELGTEHRLSIGLLHRLAGPTARPRSPSSGARRRSPRRTSCSPRCRILGYRARPP